MKKVLYIVTVLLVYCGLWIGADNGIGAGTILETIWGGLLLFMTEVVLYCLPMVIARYIVKRAPFNNAKEICATCTCIYAGSLIKYSNLDPVNKIFCSAGIGIGAWLSYQMLSK